MMTLKPIGRVENPVRKRGDMPMEGAPSQIKILARYKKAIFGIKRGMHVWVLCYFHKADKTVLRARPRKLSSSLAERGVFAMRSPDRPNPVSLSCAKVFSVNGLTLKLSSLDAMNGTPVVDIKPYCPGIDSVQSAYQPDFSRKYRLVTDRFLINTFLRTARNFCGGPDKNSFSAAALAFKYARLTGRDPQSAVKKIRTNLKGRGLDSLYALFSLRPSSGKVEIFAGGPPELQVFFAKTSARLKLSPQDVRRLKKLSRAIPAT